MKYKGTFNNKAKRNIRKALQRRSIANTTYKSLDYSNNRSL